MFACVRLLHWRMCWNDRKERTRLDCVLVVSLPAMVWYRWSEEAAHPPPRGPVWSRQSTCLKRCAEGASLWMVANLYKHLSTVICGWFFNCFFFPVSKKSVPMGTVFFVPDGSGLMTKTVILGLTTVPCTENNTVHLPSTNVEDAFSVHSQALSM